jgi:hypothetical protein
LVLSRKQNPFDEYRSNHRYENNMRRVLATDFGIWPMILNMERPSDLMVSTPSYWSRLANYLLMYDQIVIPTGNLQILSVLRMMLGEATFDELIRNRVIVLARYDKWFGYVGGGGGLMVFAVGPGEGQLRNLATNFFGPLDEAIDVAITTTNPPSSNQRRREIKNLLLDNVVLLPTQSIFDGLAGEAYKDVESSPYLRDFLSLKNGGRPLNSLKGTKPGQVTIFSPHVPPEPSDSRDIRSVLRVGYENLVLSIGGHVEATEIIGDESSLTVLQAKGQRLGMAINGDGAFARMQEVSGVPDIGSAFAAKRLSAAQLLDLRHSRHAQSLRDWFDKGSPSESADETLQRYVESISKVGWIDTLPAKLLRFAATTELGVLGTIPGAIASGVDSFLLSKWFPVKSPRLFMKQAKIMLKNSPVVKPPSMKGRDRNQPCSCGSGKKLKHCCGR